MSANHPSRDEIFNAAADISDRAERAAYLARVCGEDTSLRTEIEELLEHDLGDDSLLDRSAQGFRPTIVPPVTELPGDTIGPYKLLQQIGEGGMGVVYMAEQTDPVERRVALKIIKPGMDTRQVIARFEAERQALAMMDHPNIAKVLDAGQTDSGRPYFVMELVKGLPVTQYCDKQHLTPRERLDLFLPICQAVQHAHQKGIIHRDIKPSNVLVALYDGRPIPKVIDFGVAKAVSHKLTERTMFTQYGQIVGTIEYMSPEQAELNQLDVDTRSDIYSLGVLLYELLTGETPFDKQRLRSAAFDELLRIIREEEPPRPSTKLSSSDSLANTAVNRKMEPKKLSLLVRGELDWIVMKALEKDRGRRYETASKFAEDIHHYLNDEAVAACPPSAAYKFRKFARRNKAIIGTTTAIAASLIAGIIGTSWQAYRAIKAEGIAENRLSLVESQKREIAIEKQKAVTEAERAEQEAAIARAVNAFLQKDLLAMGDAAIQVESDLAPDPDVALRTVLDRAAENVAGRFPDRPLVEAEIQTTIGNTYQSLGLYKQAEAHHQQSVEIRQSELGPEHADTLLSISNLANCLRSQGEYARALELHTNVRKTRERIPGVEHRLTFRSMYDVAIDLQLLGNYVEAEKLQRQTVELSESVLGDDDPDTLRNKEALANILMDLARYTDAEKMHGQILEARKTNLPLNHPDTLRSMHNLGVSLYRQEKYKESELLLRELVKHRRQVLGPTHPDTLSSVSSLALAQLAQGQDAEAQELLRQALALNQQVRGSEHPQALFNMFNLGVTHSRQGDFSSAEEIDRLAMQISLQVFGENHPDTLLVMNNLGYDLLKQGKYLEAGQILSRAIQRLTQVFPREHPRVQSLIGNTTSAAWHLSTAPDLSQRDSALSLRCARTVVDLQSDNANNWDNLGVALLRNERSKEAVDALEKARDMRGGEDPDHEFFLAMAYWKSGALDAGVQHYLRARERLKKRAADSQLTRFCEEAAEVMPDATILEFYSSKIETDPDSADRYRERALFYEMTSNWDAAAADWARVIDLTEDHGGWASPRKNTCRELIEMHPQVFRRLTESHPEQRALWIAQGQYYALRNQWEQAARSYARVVDAHPISDEVMYEYAGVLLLTDDVMGYRKFCQRLRDRATEPYHPFADFVLTRTFGLAAGNGLSSQLLTDWATRSGEFQDTPWVLHASGLAYYRAGNLDAAVNKLQQSNAGNWTDVARAQNWLVQAMIYHKRANEAQAQDLFQRAMRIIEDMTPQNDDRPTSASLCDWIGLHVLQREAATVLPPAALEEFYAEKITAEPDSVSRYRQRARFYETHSQLDKAAADWIRVVDLTPDDGGNHAPRKRLCRDLAARPEMFQRMAELYPEKEVLWVGQGQFYSLRSAWAEAAASYAKAVSRRPIADETHVEYAGTLLLAGEADTYQEFCKQILEREEESQSWFTNFVLARTCAIGPAHNIPSQQLIDWAQAVVDQNRRAWTLHVLGLAYFRAGEYSMAIETLEKSNASGWYDAGQAQNWLILSIIYHEQNNEAEAKRWFQRAQEVIERAKPQEPDQAASTLVLEWIELELLRREAAIRFNSKPGSDALQNSIEHE